MTVSSPALDLPAVTVACPACGAQPGALCTSHSGTRIRRADVHQARTAAWRSAPLPAATEANDATREASAS